MNLEIQNKVEIKDSDENILLSYINKIRGNEEISNDFILDKHSNKTYTINPTKAASLIPIDILNDLGINKNSICFLYICIRDNNYLTENNNKLNFTLQLGTSAITTTEFHLANISELTDSPLITNITCPTDYTGILTIIAAENSDSSTSI